MKQEIGQIILSKVVSKEALHFSYFKFFLIVFSCNYRGPKEDLPGPLTVVSSYCYCGLVTAN